MRMSSSFEEEERPLVCTRTYAAASDPEANSVFGLSPNANSLLLRIQQVVEVDGSQKKTTHQQNNLLFQGVGRQSISIHLGLCRLAVQACRERRHLPQPQFAGDGY